MTTPTAILIAIAGSSAMTALVNNFFSRGKMKAQVELTLGEGWQKLFEAQRIEINHLRQEIDELKRDYDRLRSRCDELERENIDLRKELALCTNPQTV